MQLLLQLRNKRLTQSMSSNNPRQTPFSKLTDVVKIIGCFVILHLIATPDVAAQKLPARALQLRGGYSIHGSGDLKGISVATEYRQYLRDKLSVSVAIGTTIHHGKALHATLTGPGIGIRDNSFYEMSAGIQLLASGGFSVIRSRHHELLIDAGLLLRYQYSSLGTNGWSVYTPQTTGLGEIVVAFNNQYPVRTLTVGYQPRIEYNYTFRNRYAIAISAAFQNDTEGDAIPSLMLGAIRRF
jgi:hypothetical protein